MASYSKSVVEKSQYGVMPRGEPAGFYQDFSDKVYAAITKIYLDSKDKGIDPDFSKVKGLGKFDKVEVTEIGGDLAIGISPIMDYSKVVPAGK